MDFNEGLDEMFAAEKTIKNQKVTIQLMKNGENDTDSKLKVKINTFDHDEIDKLKKRLLKKLKNHNYKDKTLQ